MQSENFSVQNIKCNGCIANVRKGLEELPGVSSVEASVEGGKVTVHGDSLDRATLAAKLAELGYPEA